MSDSGRTWLNILLTTTNGSILHTLYKPDNTTAIGPISAIYIGHLTDVSIHIYNTSSDTIKLWGTNESSPSAITNAIQLGTDITADGIVVVEDGPMYLFIEFDTDGGGDPWAIVTGRQLT